MKRFLVVAAVVFGSFAASAQVLPVPAASSVANHTCTIVNSDLLCWGANSYGQVGNGDINGDQVEVPITVITGGVSAVAIGGDHTCAIVGKGALQCWGSNSYGQLGNGSTTDFIRPVTVIPAGVTAVTAGIRHTCAIVGGKAKCWGRGDLGQLGDSLGSDSALPVFVTFGKLVPVQIKAGYDHTCAVMKDTSIWCWGYGSDGQLGDGLGMSSPIPVQAVLFGAMAVQSAGVYSCAIVFGAFQCWGENVSGQFGNGGTSNALAPVTIIPNGVTSFSLGEAHSCVVRFGSLRCTGENGNGQLGNGTNIDSVTHVLIFRKGVSAVAAGQNFTCAIVDGNQMCWGSNGEGQLGDGSGDGSEIPVSTIIK